MPLSCGIVGLPNVGKSTLFKALTKKQVDCSNYPFCTIEPNVGVVGVKDERLDKLAKILGAGQKIPAVVEFVDIAGLVKGAHKGEGLGNQFLSHIREVEAILYLLRGFQNEKIASSQQKIDVLEEKQTLDSELILKDISVLEKALANLEKESKQGDKPCARTAQGKQVKENLAVLEKAKNLLLEEKILSAQDWPKEESQILKSYCLLTLKPRLYLFNASDNEVSGEVKKTFQENNWPFLIIDVLTESQAADFSESQRKDFGLSQASPLDELIGQVYNLLGLITFFTTVKAGEVRAWQVKQGSTIQRAAGLVHTDFSENFIKAEVINWQSLVKAGGLAQARSQGLLRTEGRDYLVQDGDVIKIIS